LLLPIDALLHRDAGLGALGRAGHELPAGGHQVGEELGAPPQLTAASVPDPSPGNRLPEQRVLGDEQHTAGQVEDGHRVARVLTEELGGHQAAGCGGKGETREEAVFNLLFNYLKLGCKGVQNLM